MRVDFIVPRYGPFPGGAEGACRLLAEHLALRPGWSVRALSTTAVDSVTWRPQLEPGTTTESGVTVERFDCEGRDPEFGALSERLLSDPERVSPEDEELWLAQQGPVSAGLLQAVADSDADVMVFTPYLYHPTVAGMARSSVPKVLQPATHDEPPAWLPMFQPVYRSAQGLCFYSDEERRVAQRLYPIAASRQLVLGVGVEAGDGDAEAFRSAYELGSDPYLVAVGRVEAGKGSPLLAELFATYKQEHPGPLKLVLVGQVVEPLAEHPDIVCTGMVDERAKWGAVRGALALVSTSVNESFSLVVLEAMAAATPVLVTSRAAVTKAHVERSGGGFAFSAYGEFAPQVTALLRSDSARAVLARRAREYAQTRYSWSAVTDRYARFLEQVARG
ncbi:MAG: hypothetical protein AVDCRST_MAG50-2158 [uncultured Acidimicrobiales bacterium]|uniref:Glycosyl transferase family 1 domain-containing protein n=1 Tax=uncultured Acidimicrobiales bacterium TaxID=310071 RepID=A0A6J4I4D4_9ACTN|nr:MAG: hypothetical protein AVDCRST_MAG50-2158 [uncultured Acidimicrobiales bacterium]